LSEDVQADQGYEKKWEIEWGDIEKLSLGLPPKWKKKRVILQCLNWLNLLKYYLFLFSFINTIFEKIIYFFKKKS
jgi:hypothetical protein